MKIVTAAIIKSDNKILLTRRKKGEKLEGAWEFPGGKVEMNETLQQGLEREILEELKLIVEAGNIFTTSLYTYSHGSIKLIAIDATILSGKIELTVHDKADWVPVKNLLDYNLAPADIPIAKELIENDRRN